MKTILLVMFVDLVVSAASLFASGLNDAVVQIGGCSGVNVDPAGIVLSVKHCELPETVKVKFSDREVEGRRVYSAPESEGPVAFALEGGGYPFAIVAADIPKAGDEVFSMGYPAEGNKRVFKWGNAKVISGAELTFQGGNFQGNKTTPIGSPGWSGGPLFNASGEVVGLMTGGDESDSVWVSYAATFSAFQAAIGKAKPALVMFTAPFCGPCMEQKADIKANAGGLRTLIDNNFAGANGNGYREITWLGVTWSDAAIARQYVAKFGKQIKTPTLWVVGSDESVVGYSRGETEPVKKYLSQFVDGKSVDLSPVTSEATEVKTEPEIDWSAVTLVAVASNKTPRLARLLKGPVTRAIANLSDGKASLVIVAERTSPARYAAVIEAANIDPNPISVFALVQKQDVGFFKGLGLKIIEKKLEPIVGEKLPIELILERTNRADFDAITKALQTPDVEKYEREPKPEQTEEKPAENNWKTEAVAEFKNVVVEEFQKRDKSEPEPAQESDDEKKSIPARIVAFFMMVLTFAETVKGIRNRLALRAAQLGIGK